MIRLLTVAVVVPAIVLGVVIASFAGSLGNGFDELSQRAAPQVAAAADLSVELSKMDAQVANVLLVGNDVGLSGNRQRAMTVYTQGQTQADSDIQRVAAIGGSDPNVARTVRSILDNFGNYQALAGEAVSLNTAGADPAGHPSGTELAVYLQATALMPNLLNDTQALIAASQASLNATYDDNRSSAVIAMIVVILVGVILLAALVSTQVYLRRRLRRRFNPAMGAATLIALVVTILVPVLLGSATGHLRTAKKDALDPIIALSQARAIGQESAANESRFLVDPTRSGQYKQDFQNESQQVIKLDNTTIDHYDGALRTALDAYDVHYSDVRFDGYFAVAIAHTDSLTDRYATIRAMARYAGYELADRAMRSTGDLRDAIQFDTGTALGYSTYNLGQYDTAVSNLISIKQQVFDQAVSDGTGDLSGWSAILPAIVALLIVALVGVGVWPRLVEYRG